MSRGLWSAGTAARLSAFGVAYFGLSLLGLWFVEPNAHVAVMWPASGLALAVFKRSRRRLWPGLVAIVFVANVVAQALQRSSLVVAAGLAVVNALEPGAAAWLLRRVVGERTSERPAGTRWVAGLAAAAGVANGLTAVLGAAIVATAFDVSALDAWSTWWLADGLGMLTVAPMLLGLSSPAERGRVGRLEIAITLAATLIGALAFWHPFDTELPPLP